MITDLIRTRIYLLGCAFDQSNILVGFSGKVLDRQTGGNQRRLRFVRHNCATHSMFFLQKSRALMVTGGDRVMMTGAEGKSYIMHVPSSEIVVDTWCNPSSSAYL